MTPSARCGALLAAGLLLAPAPSRARLGEKPGPPEDLPDMVIYGQDDRVDVYELPSGDRRRELAKSVVAIIPLKLFSKAKHGAGVDQTTLGDYYSLRTSERFSGQPAAANCSGVLVGEQLVLTAAHCFENELDCKNYVFAFDYMYETEGQDLRVFPFNSLYWCVPCDKKSGQVLRKESGYADWALACLDRPTGRKPVPLNFDLKFRPYDEVYAMGFPSGLPLKISGGAQIRDLSQADRGLITANLDIFGGNSGGPVFLSATNQLVGIVRSKVAAHKDYVPTEDGKHQKANVMPESYDEDYSPRIYHPVKGDELDESLGDFGED